MRLPILQHPNEILSSRVSIVENPSDPVVKQLISDMFETMRLEGGIGLAANQVGILQAVIVIDTSNRKGGLKTAMINPFIHSAEGEVLSTEGCLSFKSRETPCIVKRASKIRVTYLNENGAMKNKEFEGITAVCIQHEIDHLRGITMIDVEVNK